jgi:hypothetical protein
MVQIMTNESSKIVCSCLAGRVGGGDPMNKRVRKGGLNKAWCIMRRNVAKVVMFLIQLQRNVLGMHLRKMNRYPLEHLAELVLGYLAHVPHQEIRMQDSIARVSLIKERPVSRKTEVTDGQWLVVVVLTALIGHVDEVRILHSTRLSYIPVWWRHIFPPVIGGSRWDLKRDTY